MKKETVKLILVILGGILFNIIFWSEKIGINAALFDVFIVAGIFWLYPPSAKNSTCIWIATGHMLTTVMIVVHNTVLSKIAFTITLLLFVSFAEYIHRSAWYAGGSVLVNYLFAIPNFFSLFKNRQITGPRKTNLRPLRMLLIPVGLVSIFFIIYGLANKVFSTMASDVITAIQHWFENIFDWVSLPRFGFFLLGIIITAGLFLRVKRNYFSEKDAKQKDDLSRDKTALKKWKQSPFSDLLYLVLGRSATGILAIKTENAIGVISLVLLNILLLFINFLDIKYVWLGFTFSPDVSLSAYVHEGAGLLILSIILAMMLLLFFFRGNINFYKQNKWLRFGAYLWIFQNIFLVVSVLIRDYYYISHYGLAYKRIGLLFFLIMVGVGLVSVFIKIHFKKTAYYLLRTNAWAAIFLLVVSTTIHWDYTIADYNLRRKDTIPLDIPFLLSLTDRALPLIDKHKEVLLADRHRWYFYKEDFIDKNAIEFFEYRKNKFLQEQKNYSWLSWNVSDDYVKHRLIKQPLSLK